MSHSTSLHLTDNAQDFGLHPTITNVTIRRGDLVPTDGGGAGHFVGVTDAGVVWIAYQGGKGFNRMCASFDRRAA